MLISTAEVFKSRSTLRFLNEYAQNIHSQNGEDGVLQELIKRLPGITRYYVEFGGWDGVYLSNTAHLRMAHKWQGLLLESNAPRVAQGKALGLPIHQAMVTPANINELLTRHGVPRDLGVLSIDIDSDDLHVWRAITGHKPAIVVIEYNPGLPNHIPLVAQFGQTNQDALGYFGCNINALWDAGVTLGYTLVTTTMCNGIFVRSDLVSSVNPPCLTKAEFLLLHDCDDGKAQCRAGYERLLRAHGTTTWISQGG